MIDRAIEAGKIVDVSEDDSVPKFVREFGKLSLGKGANTLLIEQGGIREDLVITQC